jgi:eukaryotic-like serine/threonine-protein kinase
MTAITDRLSDALADRYRIERELGTGGMATVYLAHDIKHDRHVALKVLHPELAATIGVDRFLSEIKVTANLQHPNILALFDSGSADGLAYYVMPFVEGESLRDRLTRERQLPVPDALRIATGVAAAIEYAHAHRVIHRDIKPENILLQSGQPVVADFGIALAVQHAGGERMTQTGLSLGTPQYMSPEQAMGDRALDARTDIYALGVITFEMLAGEPPFTGPNSQAIVAKVLTEKPRSLAELRDTVSAQLDDAVHQALQKLPADRFASAGAFAEALRLGGISTTDRAPVVSPFGSSRAIARSWKRRLVPALLMGMAMLAGGFAVGRRGGSTGLPREWSGELLGGSEVALAPIVSHSGQTVAFQAMVDGQVQLAVLTPASGAWKVLTNDRSRGLINAFSWSPDDSRIYFDRLLDAPNGIFSISPLGTDERLVLANAGFPDALPDGSLLVMRLNQDRDLQLYRYWPESSRLDTLGAVSVITNTAFYHSFRDGKEAVFYGRATDQRDTTAHVYAIDLVNGKTRLLSRDPTFAPIWLTVTADDQWAVMVSADDPLTHVIAVARDGSGRTETLAVLTSTIGSLDVGSDGSLYFDQSTRPRQLLRHDRTTRRTDSQPIQPDSRVASSILPIPDGRTLLAVRAGGGFRVMVLTPGKEATPFLATTEETNGPLALLGSDRVLLTLGSGAARTVAIASIATGQVIGRLPGIITNSVAGSRDGNTIYYAAAKAIWAMPSNGGKARRIRAGDGVAPDPNGKYVIVQVSDTNKVRLFHVPLDGSPEHEVLLRGSFAPAHGNYLSSNAVAADGRIIVQVVPPASWFWPAAIVEPETGEVEVLPPGSAYDMKGGWSPAGDAVYDARALQSVLWRFRPATSGARR